MLFLRFSSLYTFLLLSSHITSSPSVFEIILPLTSYMNFFLTYYADEDDSAKNVCPVQCPQSSYEKAAVKRPVASCVAQLADLDTKGTWLKLTLSCVWCGLSGPRLIYG